MGLEPRAYRATLTFVSGSAEPGLTVVVDDAGTILEIRPSSAADPPAMRGLLVPGLVNAHLHLELSWAHGRVEGGAGLPAWVETLMSQRPPDDALEHARAAATRMADTGTALVCDVSNRGDTAPILAAAGLKGLVQHEVLGMDRRVQDERRALAAAPARWTRGIATRPSPHAPYSTRADVLQLAARPIEGTVASLHLAEDEAENALLATGTGPWADVLEARGLQWDDWRPPGQRPVAWLDGLGVLTDRLMVVHAVHLEPDEWQRLVARGTAVCLCPRSNLHVSGRLPDVEGLIDAGLTLALGTDSLGSSPDLDVLGEVAVLTRRFPERAARFLEMATATGARALRRRAGALRVGAAPGLVLLEDVDDLAALANPPSRQWLVAPGRLPPTG